MHGLDCWPVLFLSGHHEKSWIGFVKEATHLNAIELHPDIGRLRQWEVYAHSSTVNRFGCPAMREAILERLAVLPSHKEAD